MTICGDKERNTGLDTSRLEHAHSHDIGNWTFFGFKRSGLYEVEFALIGSSGSHTIPITDVTSFIVRYLGCENIVAITPVLVQSKRLILGVYVGINCKIQWAHQDFHGHRVRVGRDQTPMTINSVAALRTAMSKSVPQVSVLFVCA